MSEIVCIECGSDNVFVARDTLATRKCGSCSATWTPDQDVEKTDYKLLFNNESEISKDLRIKLAKKDEIIKELKTAISLLKQNVEGMSSFTFIELQKVESKIEELENASN